MILGSQTNQVVQPRGPAMAGILHKARLDTDNAPLAQQRKKFACLFHQCVLVDVQPDAYTFFPAVSYHTRHVDFGHYLCSIAIVRSAGHVPLPVEQHVGNAVLRTEVDGGYGSFGRNSCFTHNFARLHPLVGIVYCTRRIQILYDVVMLQQVARTVGCHNHFPGCGIVGHDVHRTVHDRSKRIALLVRSDKLGQTPVIHIGIGQGSPYSSGQFQCQCSFYRTSDIPYG